MALRDQLRGTGVALITPFQADFQVDYDALSKVIDFVITGGVEYIVTLGTTGESPTVDFDGMAPTWSFDSLAARPCAEPCP